MYYVAKYHTADSGLAWASLVHNMWGGSQGIHRTFAFHDHCITCTVQLADYYRSFHSSCEQLFVNSCSPWCTGFTISIWLGKLFPLTSFINTMHAYQLVSAFWGGYHSQVAMDTSLLYICTLLTFRYAGEYWTKLLSAPVL